MYSFAGYLFQPYPLALLGFGLALANLWRKRLETRGRLLCLTLPYLALLLLSLPAAGHPALGWLEWQHPPLGQRPSGADTIVVLGGGVLPPDAYRAAAELDASSIRRCLQAAALYHQRQPCLILVSGGKPDPTEPGPACADLMQVLLRQLGVRAADLLVENGSRTTFENAVESANLLAARQLKQVVLVTEAVHLPRAVQCFQKQGLAVIPAGCHYRKTEFKAGLYVFLPSLDGIADCQEAAHEWLGTAWYSLKGRI